MPPAAGATPACAPALASAAVAVIDTNIWLDLYVFHDPWVQPLSAALAAGSVVAVRSGAIDAELQRVLARQTFVERLSALGKQPMDAWEKLARSVIPHRTAPWLCSDPDDQKFLDLAYSAGAAFLFTKDRALLRLARRTRLAGLAILEPRRFPGVR